MSEVRWCQWHIVDRFNYYKMVMCQVIPGLYVGSARDSQDWEQLRAARISHIVSVHDTAKKEFRVGGK